MIFIANYWQKDSLHDVTVYSNCDEVELFVNGKSIARQGPDKSLAFIPHPLFQFRNVTFEAGELKAVGSIGDAQLVSEHRVLSKAAWLPSSSVPV